MEHPDDDENSDSINGNNPPPVSIYQVSVASSSSGEQYYPHPHVQTDDSDEEDTGFVDYPDDDEDGENYEVVPADGGDGSAVNVTILPAKKGGPRERMTNGHTDIQREFMHIVIRAAPNLYDMTTKQSSKETLAFCSTHDGPYTTKWIVHFYPWGHPSGYSMTVPHLNDDLKSASLYVRLQESPTDMVEARITATVVSGLDKAETVVKNSMDNLMLCPRNKIDEFQRGTSGHGWPKISSIKDLKNYRDGFCLVVTLQVVKPEATFSPGRQTQVFQPHSQPHCKTLPRYILQRSQTYCDAFLQAKDWQSVKAHRFVLAAGSSFFRKLLEEDQGVPFVYKTENTLEELKALLDVIYHGRIPTRTFEESSKLREMIFPYGVDFVRPVFFSDYIVHQEKCEENVPHFATISEESLGP